MSNYFINKDKKTGEIVYLEYNKDGYKVSPKAKKKDAIEVNKIVFVSPEFTEKLLKKKINSKLSKLLLELNTDYDDNGEEGETRLRNRFLEAEKLKLVIINKYKKYLGNAYYKLTLKKLELIIEGYRNKIRNIHQNKQREILMNMFMGNYEEPEKKGKGR